MMKKVSLLTLSAVAALQTTTAVEIPIIPAPAEIKAAGTSSTFSRNVALKVAGDNLEGLRTYTTTTLKEEFGIGVAADADNAWSLILKLDPKAEIGKEGYWLDILPGKVEIAAGTEQGLFYGLQSLFQLLPADPKEAIILPHFTAKDEPRFEWRGMHLDVSRHFFDTDFIKRYIDHLARYKLNTFHWHLVDGPGWRVEIKKYPRLTDMGAWRKDKRADDWNWRATELEMDGKQADSYGGFYTQDEIREVVAYAKSRHVEVVPEIEMPGHSYAALAAYPELACPSNDILVEGLRGKDVFCAGNEKGYQFFQDILDEIMPLFPSRFVHIGADEVPTSAWKECPHCQKLKADHQLPTDSAIQGHFVRRMEAWLHGKGKTVIGWDEIVHDNLPARTHVMVWRDEKFANQALADNHPVIMSPGTHCYFDHYQTESRTHEKLAIGGFTSVEKVYTFDPIPGGLAKEKYPLVLGGQANVWTEFIQTPEHVEIMIFPRMCALSEALWSPKDGKDIDGFHHRLEQHKKTWTQQGIHFFDAAGDVDEK